MFGLFQILKYLYLKGYSRELYCISHSLSIPLWWTKQNKANIERELISISKFLLKKKDNSKNLNNFNLINFHDQSDTFLLRFLYTWNVKIMFLCITTIVFIATMQYIVCKMYSRWATERCIGILFTGSTQFI